MRLLLDSHILLWWAGDDARLGSRAKTLLKDADLFVSAANWWEMSIKRAHGRLNVDLAAMTPALRARKAGFVDISFAHAEVAANLPPIHGDPFDRMLIAQAQLEGLRLLTRDKQLEAYGAAVLRV